MSKPNIGPKIRSQRIPELITPNPLITHHDRPHGWPDPLEPAAFYGLVGDFINLVQEESEADVSALLITFLVAFGCMVGRQPHFQVEATRHGVNLFGVIVGDTSKARKGTATDRALSILQEVDPDFIERRKRSGLSTGEGLITAVRDSKPTTHAKRSTQTGTTSEEVDLSQVYIDTGEEDKRLLVIEGEFGLVLKQISRDGNILSAVLRAAWDGKPLEVLSRSNRDSCAKPHIAFVGHITVEELNRLLDATECFNGFANRILWCCAGRSKLLPEGGRTLDLTKRRTLVQSLSAALLKAQTTERRIDWSESARLMWREAYAELSQTGSGLFDAVTARSEAQVTRIATLYAVIDSSDLIRIEHLKAALAVWRYCQDSARFLFGGLLGDSTADKILQMLSRSPEGLTQTEINRGFRSHKTKDELARALTLLIRLERVIKQEEATGGAPVTRWKLSEE